MKIDDLQDEYNTALAKLAMYYYVEEEGEALKASLHEYDKYKPDKVKNGKIRFYLFINKIKSFFRKSWKVLPKVCTIILSVLIITASLTVTNAHAMEKIGNWIIQNFQTHTQVNSPTTDESQNFLLDENSYSFGYVPEGYLMKSRNTNRYQILWNYLDLNSASLNQPDYLDIMLYQSEVEAILDSENVEIYKTGTHMSKNYAFVLKDKTTTMLIQDGNTILHFSGSLDLEEYLKISDSFIISKQKK